MVLYENFVKVWVTQLIIAAVTRMFEKPYVKDILSGHSLTSSAESMQQNQRNFRTVIIWKL